MTVRVQQNRIIEELCLLWQFICSNLFEWSFIMHHHSLSLFQNINVRMSSLQVLTLFRPIWLTLFLRLQILFYSDWLWQHNKIVVFSIHFYPDSWNGLINPCIVTRHSRARTKQLAIFCTYIVFITLIYYLYTSSQETMMECRIKWKSLDTKPCHVAMWMTVVTLVV